MSTEFGKVKGRVELKHNGDHTVEYGKTKMYVNRFYGGVENGAMLQLTMSGDKPYIQLTKKEAMRLVKKINKAFNF